MRALLHDLRRAALVLQTLSLLVLSELSRRLLMRKVDLTDTGARLRAALQELGVTYIKLGQFLATRFDVLPEEICRELARLFDEVQPLPAATVRRVLEQELEKSVEESFASFEWTCVAAASIAQVHRAVTFDGRQVAVKVQRPSITELFAADMRLLRVLARAADRLRLLGAQPIADMLEEFEDYTRLEMNFLVEGRTADRLRANAGPYEEIPEVVWSLSTRRVLTMDFVDGFPLSQIIAYVEAGRLEELKQLAPSLDLELAVRNLARACLRQLFQTGFFHADPHPGNIILREDGTVVFIDFGIFGQLNSIQMGHLAGYIESLAIGDIPRSYRNFLQLLQTTTETDLERLQADVYALMADWYEASRDITIPASERHIGRYINDFIGAVRRNQVRMGYGLILFWRALMTLDSTALRFQQQFDLLNELQSFFAATRFARFERNLQPATLRKSTLAAQEAIRDCPARLLHTLPSRGDQNNPIEVRIHHEPRSDAARGPALALCCLSLLLALPLAVVAPGSGLFAWGPVAWGMMAIWGVASLAILWPYKRRRGRQ